jgi:hypothetical protein
MSKETGKKEKQVKIDHHDLEPGCYAAICSTAASDRAAANDESAVATPKNSISEQNGMDSRQVAS